MRTSRLTAKIDNNCIADGFQIYLHSFIVAANGEWAVVQQGLNDRSGYARRYHWHSAAVRDFVDQPHTGIVGEPMGDIMNLVDPQAKPAQEALLAIVKQNPDVTLNDARHLQMPRHHEVHPKDVNLQRLGSILAVAYDRELRSFADFLLLEQLGPRTLQTLAMVAEVVHGTPTRFSDPARYSFALGGKDGHPFPVPLKTYDATIDVLRRSLDSAKVDGREKIEGFRRLHAFVTTVEKQQRTEVDFNSLVAHEHAISRSLGGRTVLNQTKTSSPDRQLRLF